jgi:hypothetical protein
MNRSGGHRPIAPTNKFSTITTNMYFKSKNLYLLVLGVISLLFSKLFYFLLNDPEGPNLLIVMGLAIILYLLSLMVYSLLSFTNSRKLLLTIFTQIVIVIGLFIFLK